MQQTKIKRARITKAKFREINRDIKGLPGAPNSDLAQLHGVSIQTVRYIRQARTWPQYERDKRTRHERQLAGVAMDDGVRPEETTVKVLTVEEYRALLRRINGLETWIETIDTRQDVADYLHPRRSIFSFLRRHS